MQTDLFRSVILDEDMLDRFCSEYDLLNTDPLFCELLVNTYRNGRLGQIHTVLLRKGITATPMQTLEWLYKKSALLIDAFYHEIDNPRIKLLHFKEKSRAVNSRAWQILEQMAGEERPKRPKAMSQVYGTMCHEAMDVLGSRTFGYAPYKQLELFEVHAQQTNPELGADFVRDVSRVGPHIPGYEQVFKGAGRCEKGYLKALRDFYRDARQVIKPNVPWWETWQVMHPYLEHGAGLMFPILGPKRISLLFPHDVLDQWLAFRTLLTLINVLLVTQRDRGRVPIVFTEVPILFRNRDGAWVGAGETDGICVRSINGRELTPRVREILWRLKRMYAPGHRPKGFCWEVLRHIIENSCGGKITCVDVLERKFGNGDGKKARTYYTFALDEVRGKPHARDAEQILRYASCVSCAGNDHEVAMSPYTPRQANVEYWAHDGSAFHDVVESPERLIERFNLLEDASRREARWRAQINLYSQLMVEEVLAAETGSRSAALVRRGTKPLSEWTLFERSFDASRS